MDRLIAFSGRRSFFSRGPETRLGRALSVVRPSEVLDQPAPTTIPHPPILSGFAHASSRIMLVSSSSTSVLAVGALSSLLLLSPTCASAHSASTGQRDHNALARRATATYDGWTSLGCVAEASSGRALMGYWQQSVGSLTIQAGLNTCASMGYLYAGFECGCLTFCAKGSSCC